MFGIVACDDLQAANNSSTMQEPKMPAQLLPPIALQDFEIARRERVFRLERRYQ
jgi:hypothetical protein